MLNIVLVEPEIPQNTGNIARTCAATDCALHLVRPLGFEIDDRKLKRAGLDYWHLLNITYYNNIDEFLSLHKDDDMYFFTTKAKKVYTDVSFSKNSFLIFGKETKGLDENLLLKYRERNVRIPMIDEARSLNLSNSVAVAVYEALRQHKFFDLKTTGEFHNIME